MRVDLWNPDYRALAGWCFRWLTGRRLEASRKLTRVYGKQRFCVRNHGSSPFGPFASWREKTKTARTTRKAAKGAPTRQRQMPCLTMLLAALGDPMLALSWPPRGATPGFYSGFVFSRPVWRLLVAWGAGLRRTCSAVVLGASTIRFC
jgi:hypothetical protein